MKIISDPNMIVSIEVGSWLNGYKSSKNRSARVLKKLIKGARNKTAIVTPMYDVRPKPDVYICNGDTIIAHPDIVAEIKKQTRTALNNMRPLAMQYESFI